MARTVLRFSRRFVLAIVAMVLLAGVPASAQGVAPCGPTADILNEYAAPWGEMLVASGVLGDAGERLEFYVGPNKTFTVLVAPSADTRCVLAVGRSLRVHQTPIRQRPRPGKES